MCVAELIYKVSYIGSQVNLHKILSHKSEKSLTMKWGFFLKPDENFSVGKESARNAGDSGLISGSRRSPGGGNGNPLQYSCPGNPMDRGAWQAAVQRVAKSQHDWATEHSTCLMYACDIPREKWVTQSSGLELLFIYHLQPKTKKKKKKGPCPEARL